MFLPGFLSCFVCGCGYVCVFLLWLLSWSWGLFVVRFLRFFSVRCLTCFGFFSVLLVFVALLLFSGPWSVTVTVTHTHTHTHTHVCARTFCLSVVSVNLSVSLSMHLICASVEN